MGPGLLLLVVGVADTGGGATSAAAVDTPELLVPSAALPGSEVASGEDHGERGAPSPAKLANPQCPVMPAEPSEEEFHLVYKGRDVHFCCSTCIQYFRKDPHKYLSGLAQFDGWEREDPAQSADADRTKLATGGPPKLGEVWMGSLMSGDLVPFFGVSIPLFVVFLAWRRRRLGEEAFGRAMVLHVVWFTLFAACGVATSFGRHAYDLYNLWKDRDRVHFATFFDYGHPPVPQRPDQPKSLTSVYYRGNDERSPLLFNNGNYRTATFELHLEDEGGEPVTAGQDVGGRALYARIVTKRPPFTAARFFHRKAMEPIFLTRHGDPFLGAFGEVPDRVSWSEVRQNWEWEARYRLGVVSSRPSTLASVDVRTASVDEIAAAPGVSRPSAEWLVKYREWNEGIGSTADLVAAGIEGEPLDALSSLLDSDVFQGVVYVAQAISTGDDRSKVVGSRFHYGITYDIRLRGGVLQADSDLWMNALYRTRKAAAGRVPTEQWFSNQPIPELPGEAATDDPVVLGLEDKDQGFIPPN